MLHSDLEASICDRLGLAFTEFECKHLSQLHDPFLVGYRDRSIPFDTLEWSYRTRMANTNTLRAGQRYCTRPIRAHI